MTAFSSAAINFMKHEKAFIFPYAITALAPTSTKFGITTRDLIGLLPNSYVKKVLFLTQGFFFFL